MSGDTAIAPHDTMPGDTATGHDETQLCVLAETHSATPLTENPTKASPRSGATRALHVTARQAKGGGYRHNRAMSRSKAGLKPLRNPRHFPVNPRRADGSPVTGTSVRRAPCAARAQSLGAAGPSCAAQTQTRPFSPQNLIPVPNSPWPRRRRCPPGSSGAAPSGAGTWR